MEVRREIRRAILRDLALIAAIGAHDHDFELDRHHKIPRKKILVLLDLGRSLRPARTPDNPLTILRVPRAAVVAELIREPPLLSAIDVHVVDFEIAIARGGEDDLLAV